MKKPLPNLTQYGLGEDLGSIKVSEDSVVLCIFRPDSDPIEMDYKLDPELWPIFKLVAKELKRIQQQREAKSGK